MLLIGKNIMLKKIILNIAFCITSAASQAQALLPASWNFSNPSIASPPVGWALNLGTTGSLTYAFGIGDAISCRFDNSGENVVIRIADKPGPLSYYLSPQNAGAAWGGKFDIEESNDGITYSTLRTITTKTSTTTNFTGGKYTETNLKATTRYIRFNFAIKLPGGQPTPGGNMALDSVLILQAPAATTPTIQVSRNNSIITNNNSHVVGNNANFAFRIKNLGLIDTLVIDSANFSGKNASVYSVSNQFPIKVAPFDSAFVNCTLNTSGNGSRFASLNIYNNDLDKKTFKIDLYGIAGSLATEPLFSPISISPSNITAYGMNLTIADTSSLTENYIVLRKMGNITEAPADGQTYQKGDYIGTAQVAFIGTAQMFKPTYILANTNYSFKAFAFNGPASYENYLTSNATSANVSTLNGNPFNYYANINPTSSTFITDLSAKVNPHDTIFYSNYITTVINNFLTRDTTAGKKVVNCVYTGIPYIYNEPFVWNASGSTGILTREHTRAQSTMPSNTAGQNPSWPRSNDNRELPEYNDQHNLFPADQLNANGPRSNNPFGECVTVTSTSPTGKGKLGKDGNGSTVYEPKDEQKGDLARALFYMSVCYNGINANNWSLPADQGLAVLLKWHQQDPPSAEEIARHEYIASIQKNRNPFIDFPSWAFLIDFKTMNLATGKILVIETPNGGENLIAGKAKNINWLAKGISTKVRLEYTLNGTDFIFIDTVDANSSPYLWNVPLVNSTNAKIKISAIDNSAIDLSNSNFSITIPTLKLLTPTGGATWKGNNNEDITWESNLVDSIKIEIKNGSTIIWSINEKADLGKFTVAVPNINALNTRIVLTEINGNLKDSSAIFKIEESVSINEASKVNFNIYPNPSNGTFYITSNLNLDKTEYEITDITGRVVMSGILNNSNAIIIHNKGIYIFKGVLNNSIFYKKIVVE